ncbi:MAG TPA: response regulator transcription factor [Asanoa sp.]|nr:response regulator transcription factor [Asanoa sp.]
MSVPRPRPAGVPVTPISVLVVDDHVVFADALQSRLSREPDLAPVLVAYEPEQARAAAATTRPAVAVLDLDLADGDTGIHVAASLRVVSPRTRCIILTGMESKVDVVAGLRVGVRAWLPKTVDVAHLVRVIRGVDAGEAWLSPDTLGHVLDHLITRPHGAEHDPIDLLTPRESEVLQAVLDGLSRTEIAEQLHLSVNTVRTHIQNLLRKLNAHSTLELVAAARQLGRRPTSE